MGNVDKSRQETISAAKRHAGEFEKNGGIRFNSFIAGAEWVMSGYPIRTLTEISKQLDEYMQECKDTPVKMVTVRKSASNGATEGQILPIYFDPSREKLINMLKGAEEHLVFMHKQNPPEHYFMIESIRGVLSDFMPADHVWESLDAEEESEWPAVPSFPGDRIPENDVKVELIFMGILMIFVIIAAVAKYLSK